MTVTGQALAARMLKRKATERASYEARAETLRTMLLEEVQRARSLGLIGRAWLIGSLTSDAFGPHSDVDVVVEDLDGDALADWWGALTLTLDASVDVLRLETLPAAFAERVFAEGRPL